MVKGRIPLYVSYLTPITLIILGNFLILCLVLQSIGKEKNLQKTKQMKKITKVRIAAALSVLMGITWIFGFLSFWKLTVPFQFVFCIFNSLQGFFIFVFFCARIKDVQNEWKQVFSRIAKRVHSCCQFFKRKHSAVVVFKKAYSTDKTALLSDETGTPTSYDSHEPLQESTSDFLGDSTVSVNYFSKAKLGETVVHWKAKRHELQWNLSHSVNI